LTIVTSAPQEVIRVLPDHSSTQMTAHYAKLTGLPVQRQCPHANSCLTCLVSITGPEFLPDRRKRTLTLITTARDNGQVRIQP
jgi:ferredoxin